MDPIDMRVVDVRRSGEGESDGSAKHVVLLDEVGGERRLPIWIGEVEAVSLAVQLERIAVPRPLTYAFAAAVLREAGGRLREVRIDRLEEDVFYATAVVAGPDGERAVDARPSDALNLAVLLDVPIRVVPSVLSAIEADPVSVERARLEVYSDGAAAIAATVTTSWSQSLHVPSSDEPSAER